MSELFQSLLSSNLSFTVWFAGLPIFTRNEIYTAEGDVKCSGCSAIYPALLLPLAVLPVPVVLLAHRLVSTWPGSSPFQVQNIKTLVLTYSSTRKRSCSV